MGKWDSSDEEDEARNQTKKKPRLVDERKDDTKDQVSDSAQVAPDTVPVIQPQQVADQTSSLNEMKNPLFHGCRSVENYEHVNFIDQGTYGMVFKARCKQSGTIYALKQVKIAAADANKVGFPITALRETNILMALSHPNIIRVKEMVVGSSSDKVFMVMEYCENDLKACMMQSKQPFSTAEVKQLMLQLVSAMEFMHSKWFIHRDLKTSNILYSNTGRLSVCDFGLARSYGSPIAPFTAEVVTLWYRCPELLLGSKFYSTALDMWSVGCIFGELLTSKPLLPGEGEADQLTRIFRLVGSPTEDRWPGVSQLPNMVAMSGIISRAPTRGKLRELVPGFSHTGGTFLSDIGFDLLSRLLELDPSQRCSAAQALQHQWLVAEAPRPTSIDLMPRFDTQPKGK